MIEQLWHCATVTQFLCGTFYMVSIFLVSIWDLRHERVKDSFSKFSMLTFYHIYNIQPDYLSELSSTCEAF